MPFGKVPIFNRLFNREHEARGSDETISAALWDPGSDNFRTNHCSMFRFVKEMGGKCLWNILPG